MTNKLRLVVNQKMVTGEAVRFNLNKKGLSARDLSKILGVHEGNTSNMLSQGMGWRKHKAKVLSVIGRTEAELHYDELKVVSILASHGVVLVQEGSATVFDVWIPYQTVQALLAQEA